MNPVAHHHRIGLYTLLLLSLYCVQLQAASVFILHSYSQEYNWTKGQHAGFVKYLELQDHGNLLISTEYLDTKRHAYTDDYAQEIARHITIKYADYKPDIIYVTDDNALQFARDYLTSIFHNTPIIFSGVNNYLVLGEIDPGLITGVFEKKEVTPNIEIMKTIATTDDKLVFVGDASNTYEAIEYEIREELKKYPGIKVEYISENLIDDMVARLKQCQCKYVYLTTIGGIKDRAGRNLTLQKIVTTIVHSGDFVLLSMEDAYLFDGVIGGYVTSGEAQGKAAALIVSKILSGEQVFEIPPIQKSPNIYLFDEHELSRHNITLPADIKKIATIINPDLSLYQTARSLILGAIVILIILLFLVLIVAVVLLSRRGAQLKFIADELTQQKNTLIETRASLEMAQQIAQMGSWKLNLVSGQLFWSDEVYRIFELDKSKFGASYDAFLDAIHPDDRELVNKTYTDSVTHHSSYEIEHRLLMPDGRIKYVQERGATQYNEKNYPFLSHGTVQDITQKKINEKRFRQWASIFESTIEAVIITDIDKNIIDVNRAYTDITGYEKHEVLGKSPGIRKSGRHDNTFYEAMWRDIATTGSWTGEIWNRTKSGELSPEWHSISTIYDENGDISNYVGVFTDISVLKRSEEKLQHLANHDPLTGLANRSLLTDRLDRIILRLERDPGSLAVLYLDLDRFKKINDTQGHPVGDALLQEAAARLKAIMRASDTVGRLGGDEFLVLMENYDNISDIKIVVEKLREVVEKPFLINGNKLFISVSTGISVYPADGLDSATLIRNADSALYRAKETGRNNYSFYDLEITRLAASRLETENILRHALEHHEFRLFYQPKINLVSGKIIGAEALIRLQLNDGNMLPPDSFIPVAEETGLIIPVGKWVLKQAIKQQVAWKAAGHSLHMAVNISAIQIQRGDLMQTMSELHNEFKFNPADIELEVTESVLIEFPEKAVEVLTAVRQFGMSVALDDFGTGFSSLSNLKRYPISTIKIDKSFVKDILDDANDAAITRAVVAMGTSLDLQIVAEGVETALHVKFLQNLGCHQAQGYYYSRPVPAEEFSKNFLSGEHSGFIR